jgi:predicted MFS family arabinose efflux permease
VLRLFRRRQGLAIGILNGGDNLITSGVHVGSAYLLVHAGWRGAVGGLALGYLALGVLVLAVLRTGEGGEAGERRVAGSATPIPWRDARFWLLIAIYVILYGYVTTIGLHFPAFQQDLGRSADAAAWIYGWSTVVGVGGSILAGWLSERIGALATLRWIVAGLLLSSIALWSSIGLAAYYVWAAGYGIVNAGAVALLALVVSEVFRGASFGRLMGVVYAFCMAATIAANAFAAAIFDAFRSYVPVWQSYTVLLLVALVPLELLCRRARGDGAPTAPAPLHRPGRTAS